MNPQTPSAVTPSHVHPAKWWHGVVIFWLGYHLLSTVSTLIPEPSPLKNFVAPLFFHYQCVTGTDQGWNMFTSIANHRDSDVVVMATFEDGSTRPFGPIVPGMKAYSPGRTFRHHSLFDRFLSAEFANYLEPLGKTYAAELAARYPAEFKSCELHTRFDRLNFLELMRAGGEPSYSTNSKRGPWQVPK